MKHLLAAGVLLVALSGAAWGAAAPAIPPFVGTWTMVSETTPEDRRTLTLIVSESGGTYTVAFADPPDGGAPPAAAGPTTFRASKVAVKGDTLTFHVTTVSQGTQVVGEVDYALTLSYSGDKLTGTVQPQAPRVPPPPPPPMRRITATRQ